MTTTPAPLCDGETRPFVHAGDMLCVPNNVHPVGELTELSKCGSQCTFWLDTNISFATQGGKQVSFHFRQRNWVQPERLRSGFLQADLSLIV